MAAYADKNDIVISHHPYMALYLALGLALLGKKTRHHAFSFNHGNGRFFRGVMRKLAIVLFKRIDGFVVFSEKEKEIYGKYYKIPYEKFSFTHWAVNPPEVDGELPQYILQAKPYVCCMGRNNRDFGLFQKVVSDLDIPAIVVSKLGQVDCSCLPSNVVLKEDIPMKEAMQVLANSQFCVTPIKDASTGAGHITIVSAMQLGVPHILTRLPTVSDYFIDGEHGVFVDAGSIESLKMAVLALWGNVDMRSKFSSSSQAFADRWFSEEASRSSLEAYLNAIANNSGIPKHPPGWGG